ncbi:hypothetical protein VM1G_09501 [Cytospora mali]|uniref:Uncharacterized protein n=1 Tax=Cytospora mali TaxID=578113 RepID=A0A194WBY0_CYTMA|nr:hypothetical protein VM1G_09501 [Valsa mali]
MATPDESEPAKSVLSRLNGWGRMFPYALLILILLRVPRAHQLTLISAVSSMPSMGMATLITALHYRPFHKLPMLVFTPMLVIGSYLNVAGFKIDSAGLTAAWSGLYVLLAARRRPVSLRQRFTARGATRLAAMGLGTINAVAGGYAYGTGDREAEKQERKERDRWGIEKD